MYAIVFDLDLETLTKSGFPDAHATLAQMLGRHGFKFKWGMFVGDATVDGSTCQFAIQSLATGLPQLMPGIRAVQSILIQECSDLPVKPCAPRATEGQLRRAVADFCQVSD